MKGVTFVIKKLKPFNRLTSVLQKYGKTVLKLLLLKFISQKWKINCFFSQHFCIYLEQLIF